MIAKRAPARDLAAKRMAATAVSVEGAPDPPPGAGSAELGARLERAARLFSGRLAAADGERAMTYGELFAHAGTLAETLGAAGAEGSRPVALLMPHRTDAIACVVGALMAGRPYCVLNPDQPRRRIETLLAAISPEAVWAHDPTLRSKLEKVGFRAIEPVTSIEPVGFRGRRPRPRAGRERLCALYVTSGTTGSPKLVGYREEATLRRAELYATSIDARPDDSFSLASPLWTGASASALFTALLCGASLRLLEPAALAPAALAARIAADKMTVWHSTPSLFRRLAGAGALDGNAFRVVRLGGEPVLAADVELARETCDRDALFVTGYSLTEANGAATQRATTLREAPKFGPGDAGHPISGVELRVERREGEPAELGEEGEIVLGGDLIADGYAEPAASSEATAGTRFERRGRALVLRTGDHGLIRADGSLEVRGRADRRLKVRGHRVDPSEVEAAALRKQGVFDAALVEFTPGGRGRSATALFAAAEPRRGEVTKAMLRAHLEQLVTPEAMPAVVRMRDRLPLTDSGKVDRLKLARLAAEGVTGRRSAREAGSPLLDHVRRLFRQALEVDRLGPDDDFFALGGDSLAAAEVCAEIESIYGVVMEPAALVHHPSARAVARHVRDTVHEPSRSSPSVLELNPGGGEAPLFIVPGGGSDATALVPFAAAIGPHQPVLVIQLPGGDGLQRPLTRMDQITAYCMSAIHRTGARPPYRIAGASFGGLVAYDIATQLHRRGGEVDFLGLLDTPAPSSRRRNQLTEPLHQFRTHSDLSILRLRRHPRVETARLRAPARQLLEDYRLTLSLLVGVRSESRIERRMRRVRAACWIAAARFTPPPSTIRLHLYRCESQPPHLAGAALLNWDRLASEITLRPVPSRHGRYMRPPDVSHIAAAVDEDLRHSSRAPQL